MIPSRLFRASHSHNLDRMFLEMWEPHQTSAFFSATFLWLYMQLFHTLKYSVSFCES